LGSVPEIWRVACSACIEWRSACPNAGSEKARCILSQLAVERTIGKLATDPRFRTRFFANPEAATWEAGLQLSPGELEALSALSHTAVTRFSESLDPRVTRLCLDATDAARPAERMDDDPDVE
jgi:hypothetical protein